MNEEVIVLCTRHKRRCMLAAQPGFAARMMHRSRIGTPIDLCDSVEFIRRQESTVDRAAAMAALLAARRQEETPVP